MKSLLRPLLVMIILCGIVFLTKAPLKTYFEDPLASVSPDYIYDLPKGLRADKTHVISIADGDTITITGGERVRFLNMDTPELSHPDQHIREECFGKAATLRLTQLIDNKDIVVVTDVKDKDKYKRLLRYIFLPLADQSGKYLNVNAYMVGEGYARVFIVEEGTRYKDEFFAFEKLAKDAKKGLWGSCDRSKFRW